MAKVDDTSALWQEFRRTTGDRTVRDRLILTYAPLVKFVAGRLGSGLPAHVDEGDLVSYGLLGLIGAIERYDPDREIKFETYAIARIKGAIIDELRALDWVPRSVRARARDIERAIAELEKKLHRAPTDEEIADEARHDRGRAGRQPDRDLALLDRRARRALDRVRGRRPDRPDRHDRGHAGPGAAVGARADRDEGGARRGDRAPARAREARRHALLLRGADPARDRRGARRHRVARLAAAHEGDPPPQGAPRRRGTRPARRDARAALRFGSRTTGDPRRKPRMPAFEPGKIRNVAVVGHRGTGKTSLVEALLFQAGETNRLGTIEAGSTVADWDDDEQQRRMSISLSLTHAEWQERKINLIDVPGDPSFQGEARCALRVVEGALVRAQRRHGRRGRHGARLEARRRARDRARALRQHARPRARRLLPRARPDAGAALRALRRRPAADRRRARADRDRRHPPHVRLHEPRRRQGAGAGADPRRAWPASSRSTARSCSTRSSRPTRR